MHLLLLAASLLMLATTTYQLRVDNLEDVLVYPLEAPKKICKRGVTAEETRLNYQAFVESKLIQHSQALEQLLKMVSTTSTMTKRLLEVCCKAREIPSMPEATNLGSWEFVKLSNVTAAGQLQHARRFNNKDTQIPASTENKSADTDGPLERLGKKIPLYGNFVKNLAVQQFSSNSDPNVIVQPAYNLELLKSDEEFHYLPERSPRR